MSRKETRKHYREKKNQQVKIFTAYLNLQNSLDPKPTW